MTELTDTFRRRLREVRIEKGYTQEWLAIASGIGYSHIRRLESGLRDNPSLKTLDFIAQALEVDPISLLKEP